MPWIQNPMTDWPGRCLIGAVAVAVAAIMSSAYAQQTKPVALELVLALDSSSSVSPEEYDLQRRGIAEAFRDPAVRKAVAGLGVPGLAVAVLQWSGGRMQRMSVEWAHLRGAADMDLFAATVARAERLLTGGTSLGGAVRTSLAEIETNRFEGRRKVIDVSGDGFTGLSPRRERDRAVSRGVTINGLAILNEKPELGLYFKAHLIGGPGAFVLTAGSYEDFATAMRDKLLQEISAFTVAGRGEPDMTWSLWPATSEEGLQHRGGERQSLGPVENPGWRLAVVDSPGPSR